VRNRQELSKALLQPRDHVVRNLVVILQICKLELPGVLPGFKLQRLAAHSLGDDLREKNSIDGVLLPRKRAVFPRFS